MLSTVRSRVIASLAAGATAALTATLALTVSGSAQAETAASNCQVSGDYEVCTTSPDAYDDGIDTTIADRMLEYVEAQEDGSITIAMFLWDIDKGPAVMTDIAEALVEKSSDVDINVILGKDGNRNNTVHQMLEDGGVNVDVCDSGCLPGKDGDFGGVMHMKFFLFSGSNGTRVVHPSTNFSQGQLQRHQNMLAVQNDEALYYNYVGFWNRMAAGSWTHDGEEWAGADRARDGDLNTKSYFYPRTEADPVRGTLEQLTCSEGSDRVWVAASLFRSETRLPVVRQLDNLNSSGCDVRVVVGESDDQSYVLDNSGLDASQVRLLDGAGQAWVEQHNKLIVTNATYGGQEREAVYAGSHNLNMKSLRYSSDGMLRVDDSGVYDIYESYFDSLYQLAG